MIEIPSWRPVFGLSDVELIAELDDIAGAERALAARRLELIAGAETRGIPRAHGCATVGVWVRNRYKVSAGGIVKLARRLPAMPHLAKALASGEISGEQASITAEAVAEMPADLAAGAEHFLVREGAALTPDELRPFSKAVFEYIALLEVFGISLKTGELPQNGGGKTQIVVTMPYEPIAGAVSAGLLDNGTRLSAHAVHRLACDAAIIPAVLDGNGTPLDIGRERRPISGAIRRALLLRDRGCTFPGCHLPPKWADGHHLIHWADGGETSLGNGVLVCGHHHRILHQGDWQAFLAPDGIPEFVPPAHLDPDRRPRRNLYHRRN